MNKLMVYVTFDIYQPNANTTHVTSPEGFDITIHGNETK